MMINKITHSANKMYWLKNLDKAKLYKPIKI